MNYNKLIRVDFSNTRMRLETLTPTQFCAYAVEVRGVPNEIGQVFLTVFTPTNEHYAPFPLSQNDNGDWQGALLPTHFQTEGKARYEMFGMDAEGVRFPLGKGDVIVDGFESGTIPIPSGDTVIVSEIAADDGTMHRIKAKKVVTDGHVEWTSEVEL